VRILFVGVHYAPDDVGIAPFTAGLAEHFVEEGHDVTVATTFPHYPEWRWKGPAGLRLVEHRSGVAVRRFRIILQRKSTAAWRITFDTSFAVAMIANTLGLPRCDLVIAVSPPIQAGLTAKLLAKAWGAPLILLIQDLPLDLALSVGMLKRGTVYRLGLRLERAVHAMADHIVVVNEGFQEKLLERHVPQKKMSVIADWAELETIRPMRASPEFRAELGAGKRDFLALHTGNMGAKQGLINLVDAAELDGGSWRLALIGDGVERERLADAIAAKGLGHVRLLPLQPARRVPYMLAAADVLLINQRSGVVDSVVPSKLISYMCAGRPVVAAVNEKSTAAHIVRRAGCGIVVEPENPGALNAALDSMRSDPRSRRAMGAAGRKYVERYFDKDEVMGKWDRLIGDLSRSRPTGSTADPESGVG